MDRLDTMRLFVRLVETASFSKAAKVEGVVQSTASKQVAALEKRLGTQLLRRTSRGLSTTEAGRDFYDTIVQLLAELDAAEARASHGQGMPSGQPRVTVPTAFGRMRVVPLLATLLERYPGVQVDLDAGEHHVNLVAERIDVAIRIGQVWSASRLHPCCVPEREASDEQGEGLHRFPRRELRGVGVAEDALSRAAHSDGEGGEAQVTGGGFTQS